MAYDESYSGYGSPPYGVPYGSFQPNQTLIENNPVGDVKVTGEFTITTRTPLKVQAGMTMRFSAAFVHRIDGPCGQSSNPWTQNPSVAILDGNGNVVPSSLVTIGAVTQDQSAPGSYFSVVTFTATTPPGNYIVQWSAEYTPVNTQEPQVAMPIKERKGFVVTNAQAPSAHFLVDTRFI